MTYQAYVEALAFLEDLKKLAIARGVTPKELKAVWKSKSVIYQARWGAYGATTAAISSIRPEVQTFRAQRGWTQSSLMERRQEKAKGAFDVHLRRVRPSLGRYRSARSGPREVSTHITPAPNAKGYVEVDVDVGPGGFVRFHISPAWALFPKWEESFPNDVLIYRERVGASPHHWRVITGRFDPERSFVAKEQMLVIDPLTGALFLGLHITAATRKMQQARSAALMDAL